MNTNEKRFVAELVTLVLLPLLLLPLFVIAPSTLLFGQPPKAKTVDGGQGVIRQNFYVKTMDGVRFFYREANGDGWSEWFEEIRSNVNENAEGKIVSYQTKKGKLRESSQRNLDTAYREVWKRLKIDEPTNRLTHTINWTANDKFGRVFRYGY